MLKCLEKDEVVHTLAEVHEGITEQHLGTRVLEINVLKDRYYWPTLVKDVIYANNIETCITRHHLSYTP